LAPGGAERLVDAREHPTEPGGAVRREELQPVGLTRREELGERALERGAAQHRPLGLVELAEARVEARSERIRLQQSQAEAVDGGDPRAVELAREVVSPAPRQLGADARAQLTRGAAR